jgi:hypothetical protein
MDGAFDVLVVAPVMTDLDATGGGYAPYGNVDDYEQQPKGNLDVTGEYFIWTDNMASDRLDAFIVKVPGQCLYRSPQHEGPCASSVEGVEDVVWTDLINVTATGNSLKKTSGCDGCEDAGAISQQQIGSGDGYLEFTVSETNLVRFIGLNHNNTGTSTGEIPFAFKIVSGYAEAREYGQYRSDVPVVTGDVLRITVQSGVVKYSKNGTVLYTSMATPSYPLRADSALTSLNATVNNAVIAINP